ncbi:glycosyltransferase family 2 protein [Dorea sp. YH-dor228]|uniref:glycosyltransferase family 2 protein n=1 Tax=Dorea sp. YH-dor228 TaxID=3151120 RepID=UPI003242E5EA
MEPKVSILILNYLTYQDTLNLIDMAKMKIGYRNYDIIVVDNASPNESAQILEEKSHEKGYFFIANPINSGYAAGNNLGIKQAIKLKSKYILVMNNDILITDNEFIDKMVNLCEGNKKIGAVSPKIIKPLGNEELQFFERPTMWDLSFGYVQFHKRRKTLNSDQIVKIYRPQGCCMLLSAKAVQDVNYMDERTFLYGEEDILAERLLNQGYECWLYGKSKVIHNHSVTVSSTMSKIRKASISLGGFRIYLKEYRNIHNIVLLKLLEIFKFLVVVIRD